MFFFMQKQHSKMVLIPSNQLVNLMDTKNNFLKENIKLYFNSCYNLYVGLDNTALYATALSLRQQSLIALSQISHSVLDCFPLYFHVYGSSDRSLLSNTWSQCSLNISTFSLSIQTWMKYTWRIHVRLRCSVWECKASSQKYRQVKKKTV